jgi:hypothetical protein
MVRVNAQQWLQKWSTNLNGAGTYIKNGVNGVQTAPGQSAAAAQDRMLNNLTAAIQSGKWARNVSAVSLQTWQSAMINKGIPRIAQGTAQAVATKSASIETLLANVAAAQAVSNALPKGGIEQGIARANAFMRAMSQASGKRS